jgi:TonB family protein
MKVPAAASFLVSGPMILSVYMLNSIGLVVTLFLLAGAAMRSRRPGLQMARNPRLPRTPSAPLSRQALGDSACKFLNGVLLLGLPFAVAACSTSTTSSACKNAVAPTLTSSPGLAIPEGFWTSHREGTVAVETLVHEDGSVTVQRVVSSSGHDYSVLAVEAVKKWRYSPLLCDGVPTRLVLTMNIRFSREGL